MKRPDPRSDDDGAPAPDPPPPEQILRPPRPEPDPSGEAPTVTPVKALLASRRLAELLMRAAVAVGRRLHGEVMFFVIGIHDSARHTLRLVEAFIPTQRVSGGHCDVTSRHVGEATPWIRDQARRLMREGIQAERIQTIWSHSHNEHPAYQSGVDRPNTLRLIDLAENHVTLDSTRRELRIDRLPRAYCLHIDDDHVIVITRTASGSPLPIRAVLQTRRQVKYMGSLVINVRGETDAQIQFRPRAPCGLCGAPGEVESRSVPFRVESDGPAATQDEIRQFLETAEARVQRGWVHHRDTRSGRSRRAFTDEDRPPREAASLEIDPTSPSADGPGSLEHDLEEDLCRVRHRIRKLEEVARTLEQRLGHRVSDPVASRDRPN